MAVSGTTNSTLLHFSDLSGTGLDTDSLVTQLMKAERVPLDQLNQKKQIAEWKQDDYRSVTSLLQGFNSDYFDVLKPGNYMLSQNTFKKFTATSSDSSYVTISGSSTASVGTHSITVKKLATADVAESVKVKGIAGDGVADGTTVAGKDFNVTINGVTNNISFGASESYSNANDLVNAIQNKIDTAFGGTGKAVVIQNAGVLSFYTGNGTNSLAITSGNTDDALAAGTLNITQNSVYNGVTKALEATPVTTATGGGQFKITLDGVTKEFLLDDYSDLNDMVSKFGSGLQALVDKGFGVGKIKVSNDFGKLKFETVGGAGKITLSSGSQNNALGLLGFDSGASNRLSTSETLDSLSGKFEQGLTFSGDQVQFAINSRVFTFNRTTTLSSMLNTINSDSSANVIMQYDEANDKFVITAKQMGAGANIDITQSMGNFFDGATKISTASPVTQMGQDAEVVLDGATLVRSSNSFSVNGTTYNLLKANDLTADPGAKETVSLSQDVDSVYNSIKSFVDKYNDVINTINGKLSETYDRDYQPLTDDQKSSMNDDDIKNWETKAKTGLLRNDSILQNIVYDMRRALYDKVSSVGVSLSDIGITTGSYTDKGKLIIDDTKLRAAIQNDPDSVMSLFSQKSSVTTNMNLSPDDQSKRYSEEGLGYRISDIINKNISTLRDSDGNKGLLLEKAGLVGDSSEFTSLMYKEIDGYDQSITDLNTKLTDKENQYYQKFAAVQSALSQMQSQSSWLQSQLGGSK